jgi:ketosteroid isomerase-like protein
MRPILQFVPAVAIFMAGCASAPPVASNADHAKEQQQIRQVLNEIFDSAEKKDFVRLDACHWYGPQFTKFATEAPGRLDAAAARQGEHDGLGAVNGLSMQADDLKIDVFGDVGIATFTLKYSFKVAADTIEKKAHTTLVFARDQGAWKIVHEHLSAVKETSR